MTLAATRTSRAGSGRLVRQPSLEASVSTFTPKLVVSCAFTGVQTADAAREKTAA